MTTTFRPTRAVPSAVILLLATAAAAHAQSEPYRVFDTRPVITQGPYLIAPSESTATIVWLTDTPSHSKVRYGKTDLSLLAEPQRDGMVPVGTIHTVHLTGLEPGTTYRYQAVSTRVVKLKAYWPDKGLAVESPEFTFTTFDRRKPAISFSFVTDTHEDVRRINALMKGIDWTTTDFLAHGGDAFDWIDNEEHLFRRWLEPVTAALAHAKPLLYVRGNHEMRGAFARNLFDYVPTIEGRYYFARDHGPVHFLFVDSGEDKPDATNVYADLNRLKEYRAAELAWFEEHVRTSKRHAEAPFRIVVLHQPGWGWVDGENDRWTDFANEAGVDLMIAGHRHRHSLSRPGEGGRHKYHILVVGQDQVARVNATGRELSIAVTGTDGAVVSTLTIPARR